MLTSSKWTQLLGLQCGFYRSVIIGIPVGRCQLTPVVKFVRNMTHLSGCLVYLWGGRQLSFL